MKSVTLMGLMLLSVSFLKAQPPDPGEENPTVPITGIEVILAAGALFGAKKAYELKRKSS